ncbi:hypothetical protein [Paucilactobacillus kaifaensis]|uniref:hypothetical protein n=1 Tax=Paucilactobacillus kaifaensis TaxID=2559921 RepID=UPI0010F78D1C|nr:hypothetical protein [Paucilactobacillus kaifaensis]
MESRQVKFKSKVQLSNQKHHRSFNLIGIIVATVFLMALIFNGTIFNQNFVAREISKSSISTTIVTNVNQELSQYGLPDNIMTKKEANRLVKTSVKQVYAGNEIKLNLNPVFTRAEKLIDQDLSGLGVSTSQLPTAITSTVKTKINEAITQQINTARVKEISSKLLMAKKTTTMVLVLSTIILILLLIWALMRHHLIASLSWILIISSLLALALIKAMMVFLNSLVESSSYLSTLSSQAIQDLGHFGNGLALTLLIVGAILLGLRRVFRG